MARGNPGAAAASAAGGASSHLAELDVLATGELRQRLHRGGPSQELQQLAERMQALTAQ